MPPCFSHHLYRASGPNFLALWRYSCDTLPKATQPDYNWWKITWFTGIGKDCPYGKTLSKQITLEHLKKWLLGCTGNSVFYSSRVNCKSTLPFQVKMQLDAYAAQNLMHMFLGLYKAFWKTTKIKKWISIKK